MGAMKVGALLNDLASIIVLISGVIIAIKNIYAFFKKPVEDLQKKARENEEKHIIQVFEEKIPELLKDHGKSVGEERKKETEALFNSLKDEMLEAFDDKTEELKEIDLDQNKCIQRIQTSIDRLNESQLDTMRYNMNRIYYKYQPYKKILDYDKKAFMKFYTDYHQMGGNTWIDQLYNELKDWDTVQNISDLKT